MVEPASSTRSTNLDSPQLVRRRRKQKAEKTSSIGSSVSLIDLDVDEPQKQGEAVNVMDESEEKQKTCMDSIREFGVSCKEYFEEIANNMIDYFNEISADYRAIAEQLEREWTIKYKENIRIVHGRRDSKELGEGSSTTDPERIAKSPKVILLSR